MARSVSTLSASLAALFLIMPMAAAQGQDEVGEPIAADSPDMLRHAQSHVTPAQALSQRLGLARPLDMEGDWSRFDADRDNSLGPLEFGLWIMAAKGQETGGATQAELRGRAQGNAAVELLNATAAMLVRLDANGDWRVSREELALIAE